MEEMWRVHPIHLKHRAPTLNCNQCAATLLERCSMWDNGQAVVHCPVKLEYFQSVFIVALFLLPDHMLSLLLQQNVSIDIAMDPDVLSRGNMFVCYFL